ncbi:MAG: hypothetical protein V1826_03170 [bacterium]
MNDEIKIPADDQATPAVDSDATEMTPEVVADADKASEEATNDQAAV